jgi:hypothetical protein
MLNLMGQLLRDELAKLQSPFITTIRGKGLLNAIVIKHDQIPMLHGIFALALKENGLLAKPTHGDKIRFAPPVAYNQPNKEQVLECHGVVYFFVTSILGRRLIIWSTRASATNANNAGLFSGQTFVRFAHTAGIANMTTMITHIAILKSPGLPKLVPAASIPVTVSCLLAIKLHGKKQRPIIASAAAIPITWEYFISR